MANKSNASGLSALRKSLQWADADTLRDLLFRMAKLRSENKELLDFVINHNASAASYAQVYLIDMQLQLEGASAQTYFLAKTLRKLQRSIARFYKITKDREQEMVLWLFLCDAYIDQLWSKRRASVLDQMYDRWCEKVKQRYDQLHEDLRYDYANRLANHGIVFD